MKVKLCVLIGVVTLTLLTGMAWGYPTRFAPATGLVDMPTADIAPAASAQVAADYMPLGDADGTKVWPLRLLVGISSGVEAGFGYARLVDGSGTSATSFSLKKSVMQESVQAFGLAVGASFINAPISDMLNLYVVASKELQETPGGAYSTQQPRLRTRGHLGLMYSRLQGLHDSEVQPFVGFDATTPQGSSVVADYKLSKFGKDAASVAFRYPITPAVTAQVGISRAGAVVGQDDFRVMVGVNYNFAVPGEGTPQND